jgi:hypothetical protein
MSTYQLVAGELENASDGLTVAALREVLHKRGVDLSVSVLRAALREGLGKGAFMRSLTRPFVYWYVPPRPAADVDTSLVSAAIVALEKIVRDEGSTEDLAVAALRCKRILDCAQRGAAEQDLTEAEPDVHRERIQENLYAVVDASGCVVLEVPRQRLQAVRVTLTDIDEATATLTRARDKSAAYTESQNAQRAASLAEHSQVREAVRKLASFGGTAQIHASTGELLARDGLARPGEGYALPNIWVLTDAGWDVVRESSWQVEAPKPCGA